MRGCGSDVRHLLVVVLALLVANTTVLACKDLLPALVNLELDHLDLFIAGSKGKSLYE